MTHHHHFTHTHTPLPTTSPPPRPGLNLSARPTEQLDITPSLNAALLLNMSSRAADPARGASATANTVVDVEVMFTVIMRAWLCEADTPCANRTFDEVSAVVVFFLVCACVFWRVGGIEGECSVHIWGNCT